VATRFFFDLLLEQINLEIALKNQANNDTIYKIAQGRYNLGKIAEDELLQLELTLMNCRPGSFSG
jgi:outer membrane protein